MRVSFVFLPVALVLSLDWDALEMDFRHLKYFIHSEKERFSKCQSNNKCPVKVGSEKIYFNSTRKRNNAAGATRRVVNTTIRTVLN